MRLKTSSFQIKFSHLEFCRVVSVPAKRRDFGIRIVKYLSGTKQRPHAFHITSGISLRCFENSPRRQNPQVLFLQLSSIAHTFLREFLPAFAVTYFLTSSKNHQRVNENAISRVVANVSCLIFVSKKSCKSSSCPAVR